jgi:uncharacterized protein with von Willebrand factor type A (vWA) domain
VLPDVDRAAFAAAFTGRLRDSGVSVGLTGAEDFVRALTITKTPLTTSRLYWIARICLVRRYAEIEVFDAVWASVFGAPGAGLDPHARRRALPGQEDAFTPLPSTPRGDDGSGGLSWLTLPAVVGTAEAAQSAPAVPERLPSDAEGLADLPFEQLDPRQLALLGRWLEEIVTAWPTRRGRRFATGPRGHRISVRATLARARRTGWEPVRLTRHRPVVRPRRVVMLCDVSQSMQAQATAYLHLMRALTLGANAEVFAFATTLTRLTPVLAHRSAAAAISQATDRVGDRFGGTRIATNIRALLTSRHGAKVRGAIVLVASDGWDRDPPEQMTAAMERLQRRAHRVLWLNPRASAPGFEPRVAAMAAALPHCDRLLPAGTFASLRAVLTEITQVR